MKLAFAARFTTRTRDEWVRLLAGQDTCVAPVLDIPEVTADAHLRARCSFIPARHPRQGGFEQLAPVLAGGDRHEPEHVVGAPGATDTDAVLGAAGFGGEEIAGLRTAGIIE
jgi:alpha-methylacyl-CoA racemase